MKCLARYLPIVRSYVVSHRRVCMVAIGMSIATVGGYLLCAPPADFPSGSIVRIRNGASALEVSTTLAEARIVAHQTTLRTILRIVGKADAVQSGIYQFQEPQNAFTIVRRITTGDYGLPPVRITFVEGVTAREMSALVASAFPDSSPEEFRSLAEPEEGYLFPDTYFFPPSADAKTIILTLRANFDAKAASLANDIQVSGRSLSDIVTMASLVEKEARTNEVRRMVAGILWNRLDLGMPLQVDAVFGYIFDRATYSPSYADLKVDSPYNTYTHTGLPPTPICNPGSDALLAVMQPTKTNYLYYLTDTHGVMHYATTYAGHQVNQRKYLP